MYQPMPGMPAAQFLMDLGYTRNYEFRNYFYVLSGISIRVLKPRPIEIRDIEFRDVYPVLG